VQYIRVGSVYTCGFSDENLELLPHNNDENETYSFEEVSLKQELDGNWGLKHNIFIFL